jgi:hypothetical protein
MIWDDMGWYGMIWDGMSRAARHVDELALALVGGAERDQVERREPRLPA